MAAFLGNAILTLPQGRKALTVTQMYLTIMEKSFCKMESNALQTEEFWCPKLTSARETRKMYSQQQQYFTIICMKTPQNNRTGGYSEKR